MGTKRDGTSDGYELSTLGNLEMIESLVEDGTGPEHKTIRGLVNEVRYYLLERERMISFLRPTGQVLEEPTP